MHLGMATTALTTALGKCLEISIRSIHRTYSDQSTLRIRGAIFFHAGIPCTLARVFTCKHPRKLIHSNTLFLGDICSGGNVRL